jgi:cytochrome c biogenesis protein CcmG/thiol:disulfide interchange protein DsbE
MKTTAPCLACWVALLVLVFSPSLRAALLPAESDEFNGLSAPAFSTPSVEGKAVSLSNYTGQVVLINFFASWCPPCREEIAQLSRLQKEYGKQGLAVIGLAVDPILTPETAGDVKPLARKLEIPYPVALATKPIADAYHFKGIPTTIVIGAEGRIIKTFYGYHDAQRIEEVVKSALPEKKPDSTTPKPSAAPKVSG